MHLNFSHIHLKKIIVNEAKDYIVLMDVFFRKNPRADILESDLVLFLHITTNQSYNQLFLHFLLNLSLF